MPAPPEIGDAVGDVGHVKVHGEIEAQHLAHTDAHQRVAGEVKIQLQGIGQQTQPDQRGARIRQTHTSRGKNMLIVVGADDIIPQLAYGIRNQDLFRQAEYKQADALFDLLEAVAVLVHVKLRGHIPVFHDGTGNQLGEHNHICTEINDVVLSLHIPTVYVDGVAHGLEGIEADAQGQHGGCFHHADGKPGNRIDGADDEVGVFEKHQHGQAAHNGNNQKDPAHLV